MYWKCLVMSPGSEISLGMQVIISVLATCNTKCNYHEWSWKWVGSMDDIGILLVYHFGPVRNTLDLKKHIRTSSVPRGWIPVTSVNLWLFTSVSSRLTFECNAMILPHIIAPARVKCNGWLFTSRQNSSNLGLYDMVKKANCYYFLPDIALMWFMNSGNVKQNKLHLEQHYTLYTQFLCCLVIYPAFFK